MEVNVYALLVAGIFAFIGLALACRRPAVQEVTTPCMYSLHEDPNGSLDASPGAIACSQGVMRINVGGKNKWKCIE